MTPFEQDQLLDQVRANGNWIEPMENGLTLDGHFQLADLRKLVLVLKARLNSAYSLSSSNSLSLDPYPEELDDLKKLLVKIDATEDPVAYGNWLHQLAKKAAEERHILDRDAPGLYQAAVTEGPQLTLTADHVKALLGQRKVSFQDYLSRVEALFLAAGHQCSAEKWNPRIWRVVGSKVDIHVITADGKRPQ